MLRNCSLLKLTTSNIPHGIGCVPLVSSGSWFIKGTDESTLVTDSSVPWMHHDPSDLGGHLKTATEKEMLKD